MPSSQWAKSSPTFLGSSATTGSSMGRLKERRFRGLAVGPSEEMHSYTERAEGEATDSAAQTWAFRDGMERHLVDHVADPLGGVQGQLQHPHLRAGPGEQGEGGGGGEGVVPGPEGDGDLADPGGDVLVVVGDLALPALLDDEDVEVVDALDVLAGGHARHVQRVQEPGPEDIRTGGGQDRNIGLSWSRVVDITTKMQETEI